MSDHLSNTLSGRFVASILLLALVSGCGGGEPVPDRPETAPVSGIVTRNGEPVEGAEVVFKPASGQERGAVGKTNEKGEYQLMTYEQGDGAIPGQFLITVSKVEVIGGGDPEDGLAPPPEYKDLLPKKFKHPDTSGLKAEVKAGEENEIPLDLTD